MIVLNKFKQIKSTKKELRKFGITIGIVLVAFSSLMYLIHRQIHPLLLWQIPLVSVFIALVYPILLWPFQKIWMALSIILELIMTRVILGILFYLILTPIGLIAKWFGNDFLNLNRDPEAKTYWNRRENRVKDKSSYENQF